MKLLKKKKRWFDDSSVTYHSESVVIDVPHSYKDVKRYVFTNEEIKSNPQIHGLITLIDSSLYALLNRKKWWEFWKK